MGERQLPKFASMSYFHNPPSDPITSGVVPRVGINRWLTQFGPLAGFQLLANWTARARMRRELAQLDDRQLRDIGVSPIAVRREIIKPFWSE